MFHATVCLGISNIVTDVLGALQDMSWCQDYAFENRRFMLDLMVDIVETVSKGSAAMDEAVNIHHNFCECTRCRYTVRLQAAGSRNAVLLDTPAERHAILCMQCMQLPVDFCTVPFQQASGCCCSDE